MFMLHRNAVVPSALFALALCLAVGCGVGQGELQRDTSAGTGADPMDAGLPDTRPIEPRDTQQSADLLEDGLGCYNECQGGLICREGTVYRLFGGPRPCAIGPCPSLADATTGFREGRCDRGCATESLAEPDAGWTHVCEGDAGTPRQTFDSGPTDEFDVEL